MTPHLPPEGFDDENLQLFAAACAGDPASCFGLGLRYARGVVLPLSIREALRWLRRSARLNPGFAWQFGEALVRGEYCLPRDLREGVRWLRSARRRGSAEASYELGNCARYGAGLPKSERIALSCYREAAAQGEVSAITVLAVAYLRGEMGVTADVGRALRMLKPVHHETSLGQAIWIGHELVSCREAGQRRRHLRALRRLARDEVSEADYQLGAMEISGSGGARSRCVARERLRRAASAGHEAARQLLAEYGDVS